MVRVLPVASQIRGDAQVRKTNLFVGRLVGPFPPWVKEPARSSKTQKTKTRIGSNSSSMRVEAWRKKKTREITLFPAVLSEFFADRCVCRTAKHTHRPA